MSNVLSFNNHVESNHPFFRDQKKFAKLAEKIQEAGIREKGMDFMDWPYGVLNRAIRDAYVGMDESKVEEMANAIVTGGDNFKEIITMQSGDVVITAEDEVNLVEGYVRWLGKQNEKNQDESKKERFTSHGFIGYLNKEFKIDDPSFNMRVPQLLANQMQENQDNFRSKFPNQWEEWMITTLSNSDGVEKGGEAPASVYFNATQQLNHVSEMQYHVTYGTGTLKDVPIRIDFSLKATSKSNMRGFRNVDKQNEETMAVVSAEDLNRVRNHIEHEEKSSPSNIVSMEEYKAKSSIGSRLESHVNNSSEAGKAAELNTDPTRTQANIAEINQRPKTQIEEILEKLEHHKLAPPGFVGVHEEQRKPRSITVEGRDRFKQVVYMIRNSRGKTMEQGNENQNSQAHSNDMELGLGA